MKKQTLKQRILELRSKDFNNDAIYRVLAGEINLFHIAFFGHKGSKSEKNKLNYRWNLILKTETKH